MAKEGEKKRNSSSSLHLLSTYYVPSSVLSISLLLTDLILRKIRLEMQIES